MIIYQSNIILSVLIKGGNYEIYYKIILACTYFVQVNVYFSWANFGVVSQKESSPFLLVSSTFCYTELEYLKNKNDFIAKFCIMFKWILNASCKMNIIKFLITQTHGFYIMIMSDDNACNCIMSRNVIKSSDIIPDINDSVTVFSVMIWNNVKLLDIIT